MSTMDKYVYIDIDIDIDIGIGTDETSLHVKGRVYVRNQDDTTPGRVTVEYRWQGNGTQALANNSRRRTQSQSERAGRVNPSTIH